MFKKCPSVFFPAFAGLVALILTGCASNDAKEGRVRYECTDYGFYVTRHEDDDEFKYHVNGEVETPQPGFEYILKAFDGNYERARYEIILNPPDPRMRKQAAVLQINSDFTSPLAFETIDFKLRPRELWDPATITCRLEYNR